MKFLKLLTPLIIGMTLSTGNSTAQDIERTNPLLTEWSTPYNTPPFEDIEIKDYAPAIDVALEEALKEVNAIIDSKEAPTFKNTIEALEMSGALLDRVASVLFNLNSAETSDSLQLVARDVSPKLSEFSNYVSLNKALFEKVSTVYKERESLDITPEQLKLLSDTYRGFIRGGANIPSDKRERFAQVNEELSKISLNFGENTLAETNSYSLNITDEKDLSGLPKGVIEAAAETAKQFDKEGWVFTLHYPSYGPFITYADSRELRETIFMASATRASKDNEYNNEDNIKRLVDLRLEKANILGYSNYAEYVLEERMAQTPEKVNSFLNQLHEASRPAALKEYDEVLEFAKSIGFKGDLIQRWDWSYYSEKLKEERYGFNEEEIKPYFELSSVTKGVFGLAEKLYGLQFKECSNISKYHKDVKVYEVYDNDGTFLSIFYTDFFPRAGKQGGAWMTEYRGQSSVDGIEIRPLVSIVCNFTKPTATTPSLLSFREVETFLHEFGHALHGMLANTTYSSMSGTNVYRDFVELPSQVMENWAPEREWLDLFAKHYETGEAIPEALVNKLIKSQNYLAGYTSERQLSFGLVDMAWHSIESSIEESVVSFETKAMGAAELFPEVKGSIFSTQFSHIFAGGYAAGYYGYKWAEVLDADAFASFKKGGLFNRDIASSFRKNILEKGGTVHPMELYINFKGAEPTVDALLERSGLTSVTK